MSDKWVGPLPPLDWILAFENGELDEEALIEGFQYLANTGGWRMLQGVYGRTLFDLVSQGLVEMPS